MLSVVLCHGLSCLQITDSAARGHVASMESSSAVGSHFGACIAIVTKCLAAFDLLQHAYHWYCWVLCRADGESGTC